MLHEFLALAFAQVGDRDAGPGADDLGDVFLGDFLLQHRRAAALHLGELRVVRLELAL